GRRDSGRGSGRQRRRRGRQPLAGGTRPGRGRRRAGPAGHPAGQRGAGRCARRGRRRRVGAVQHRAATRRRDRRGAARPALFRLGDHGAHLRGRDDARGAVRARRVRAVRRAPPATAPPSRRRSRAARRQRRRGGSPPVMTGLLDYAPITATCFAVPQFLPQIRKLATTGDTADVSWSWATLAGVNNAAWITYFTLARYPTALIPFIVGNPA